MTDTAIVNCTVLEIRPVRQGRLVALATVEIDVDGVVFIVEGVQIFKFRMQGDRRELVGVGPPCYRAPDGTWRKAIRLPPEVEAALGEAVMQRCNELGIADCQRRLANIDRSLSGRDVW